MAKTSDTPLVGLVLLAVVTVLFAPIVGRNGWPVLATALMLLAVGAGVASFVLALVATLRASRQAPRSSLRQENP
jgi:protein-S-isoprenylcysteine O-methyltransferase Ste14